MPPATPSSFSTTPGRGPPRVLFGLFNSTGDTVVVGSYDRFYTHRLNRQRVFGRSTGPRRLEHVHGDQDGVEAGRIQAPWGYPGAALTFTTCTATIKCWGKFEFTCVRARSSSRFSTGTRIATSSFGLEILKINIKDDRYLTAYTAEILLRGDMESRKLSGSRGGAQ